MTKAQCKGCAYLIAEIWGHGALFGCGGPFFVDADPDHGWVGSRKFCRMYTPIHYTRDFGAYEL